MMNFLEQLVAEWYEYKGHLVRTNIKCGKRARGGWEGEMDVVAFNPITKDLIHIETSTDSLTWDDRKRRFSKKFEVATKYYETLFPYSLKPVKQLAIVGLSKPKNDLVLDFGKNIEVMLVPTFIRSVGKELSKKNPIQEAMPENHMLLRATQYASFYMTSKHWSN